MQSAPLSQKHMGVLAGLFLIGLLIAGMAIKEYNTLFFVPELQDATNSETSQIGIIPISTNDPIRGNKAAPITIIGFEDFLCENCRQQHILLTELLSQYPDTVKFIWKDLPIINIPESSELIHIYGYCMNQQDLFEPYASTMFANYLDVSAAALQSVAAEAGANMQALESCVTSPDPTAHIEKSKLLASALHIQQVPTFFVSGKQISTPQSVAEWAIVLQLSQ